MADGAVAAAWEVVKEEGWEREGGERMTIPVYAGRLRGWGLRGFVVGV
jgi:hypothetical protein